MGNNYIVGGGIAGMVAGYYLEDYTVLMPPPKYSKFPLGPTYVYDAPLTRKLLEELEITIMPGTIKVGYQTYTGVRRPNVDILTAYHWGTRCCDPDPVWLREHMDGEFKILELSDNSFQFLRDELLIQISDQVKFDYMIDVDLDEQRLIGYTNYSYDHLIWTAPLPILCCLSGITADLSSQDITVVLEGVGTLNYPISKSEFDIICFPNRQPYRITKWREPYVVSEYLGLIDGIGVKQMPRGKIIAGTAPDLSEFNVTLLGRYAQWNKTMKLHDVLKEINNF